MGEAQAALRESESNKVAYITEVRKMLKEREASADTKQHIATQDQAAEVVLENKDIGFVAAGQRAEIKLETFLFTKYGTVGATVSRVTPDAVNDEKRGAIFPAVLTMDVAQVDVEGKKVKLGPGMNVTAEIRTGKRRVIEYLLSPVERAGKESLRER